MFIIFKFYILCSFLIYLSYLDIRYRKIPNFIIAILLTIGVCFVPFSDNIPSSLLGLFFPAFILLLLNIPFKSFIGGGDIKLIMCIGLFIGISNNFIVFFIASILTLLFSTLRQIFYKTALPSLPFCPFLLISLLFSESIFKY